MSIFQKKKPDAKLRSGMLFVAEAGIGPMPRQSKEQWCLQENPGWITPSRCSTQRETPETPLFSYQIRRKMSICSTCQRGYVLGIIGTMRGMVSKRKVVIGAVVLLFLFSLNFMAADARGFATSVSSPFQAALWQAGENISTFFGGGNLKKENEFLQEENLALTQQLISLQDTAKENQELRNVLDLELNQEFQLVMGEIIGKNLGEDSIMIRAGQAQGIQKDMPVITAGKVAVGRVVEVFHDSAKVQLLSAKDKKLDARIENTEVTGIIQGQGAQTIILDFVPQEDEIREGDIVVTSTLGDIFPENILIGRIQDVIKSGSDPFQKAAIDHFFNLKAVETVFVITS